MAVLYVPHFVQFEDENGVPLSGGKLFSFAAGTNTPKATYTTAAGDIEHANPIILDSAGRATIFLTGSYKFTLTDADDVLIRTTDNVTAFTAATSTNEGFFNAFSGDGEEKEFTLTDNLGTDEKALFVYAENEYTKNPKFAQDSDWQKGTGWTIGSGVATATGAISTALSQNAQISLIQGKSYSVTYTITRSAGSITLSLGGTAGTARSASGTYSETIIAGSTQEISFGTSGFTGTLDNVSIRDVTGPVNIPPTRYTVNGTALTFVTPPADGSNNIYVYAPFTLIGAAGAAQVAADDAIAAAAAAETAQGLAEDAKDAAELAQGAAETAETNAETAETNAEASATAAAASAAKLSGTSASSVAIGTGSKAFTTQADKFFDVGVWLLIASDADEANYMHGQVTAYSGTDLTVNVTNIGGSGTLDDWKITVSGTRGAIGATGSVGVDLGAANTVLQVNSAGDALEYGLVEQANLSLVAPVSDLQAATKKYVDDEIAAIPVPDSGWVPLQTQTVSSAVASVDFTSGIDGTYKAYAIVFASVIPVNDGVTLQARLGNGGAFDSGASDYSYILYRSDDGSSSLTFTRSNASNLIIIVENLSNASSAGASGVSEIFNPANASCFTGVKTSTNFLDNAGPRSCQAESSGHRKEAAAHDRIQFKMSSGNIASGTFTLYGIAGA